MNSQRCGIQATLTLVFLVAFAGCACPTNCPVLQSGAAAEPTATEPATADSTIAELSPPDPDAYYLPFPADTCSPVGQGNFGVGGLGSHVGQYALDFVIPERTPVLAARAGKVVGVQQDCPNVNCPFDPDRCCGNYIKVRHADGTTAAYFHLVQYGACVQVGDEVARGDIIGRSGNTGISLTPHLHFAVYAARGQTGDGSLGQSRDNTLEIRFADVPGDGVPVFLGIYTSKNKPAADHCN